MLAGALIKGALKTVEMQAPAVPCLLGMTFLTFLTWQHSLRIWGTVVMGQYLRTFAAIAEEELLSGSSQLPLPAPGDLI